MLAMHAFPHPSLRRTALAAVALTLGLAAAPAWADPSPLMALRAADWPAADAPAVAQGQAVTLDSASPFTLSDVGHPRRTEPTAGQGTLYLPEAASAARPVPGAVLLHGAGGVMQAREHTYARQLAAMGVAALVVDSFAPRRDRAVRFTDRLIHITESMMLADAHAALRHLDRLPEVDGERVALIGFSYGGLATLLAAFAQVAEAFAPDGPRFAAHASFYPPCIVRFRDLRATGAPVLLLYGTGDALTDPARCTAILQDLEAGGAASVAMVGFEGAYHQWDGASVGPRRAPRNLVECAFEVRANGTVRDSRLLLPMTGPATRQASLAWCSDENGYLIGRDDAVRAVSNRHLGAFLADAFSR